MMDFLIAMVKTKNGFTKLNGMIWGLPPISVELPEEYKKAKEERK